MKKITSIFITGLITLFPIVFTFYLIKLVIDFGDNLVENIPISNLHLFFPGFGAIIVILLICGVGLIVKNYFGQKLFQKIEWFLLKIPIVKMIYSSLKDISYLFGKSKENHFETPVLVPFPNDNIYSMGFVTNTDIKFVKEDLVSVFIPTTPNPTNGFLIFVDKEKIRKLDITKEEAMKRIITMNTSK